MLVVILAALNLNTVTSLNVWPPLRSSQFEKNLPAKDEEVHVSLANAVFLADMEGSGSRLKRMVDRYNNIAAKSADKTLLPLHVIMSILDRSDALPRIETDYSYNITITRDGGATISANTNFGAQYAMETFLQLQLSTNPLSFAADEESLIIQDEPQFPWRGLMLDVGRRFSTVSLVENLLDTMAAAKMNVLHFHASDYCRWSVESKVYPDLQKNLAAGLPDEGYYSQEDIKHIVSYAADRGVRIVPEFDLPGHSFAMEVLAKGDGLQFCNSTKTYTIYNDEEGKSLKVLKELVKEMSDLFPDEVFHLGMDEVEYPAPCTAESTIALESELIDYVMNELGKTPMGWDPISSAWNVTSDLVVNSYLSSANSKTFAESGWTVVDSSNYNWYFTHPAGWDWTDDCKPAGCAGPKGWDHCWLEPGGGAVGDAKDRVLGGEISVWTDDYAYPQVRVAITCDVWRVTCDV